jgi:hypothetical protein
MQDGISTVNSSELTAEVKRMMLVFVALKFGTAGEDTKVLDITLNTARERTGYNYGTGNGDGSESLDMTPAHRNKRGWFDGGSVNVLGAFFVAGVV